MGLPVRVWARDDGAAWREVGTGQVISGEYVLVSLAPDAGTLLVGPEPPEVVLTSDDGTGSVGEVLLATEVHVGRIGSRVTGELAAVLRLAAPPAVDDAVLESPDLIAGLREGRSPAQLLRVGVGVPPGGQVTPDIGVDGLRPGLFELQLRTGTQVGYWMCRLVPWCQPRPPWDLRDRWLGRPLDRDPRLR
jgi:hypothetical protein